MLRLMLERLPYLPHLLVDTRLRSQRVIMRAKSSSVGLSSRQTALTTRPRGIVPISFLRASGLSVPPATLANLSGRISYVFEQVALDAHLCLSYSRPDTVVSNLVCGILSRQAFGCLFMSAKEKMTSKIGLTTVTAPLPMG